MCTPGTPDMGRLGYILAEDATPILFTTTRSGVPTTGGTTAAQDIELVFEQHDLAVTVEFIEPAYPARMQAFVDVWIDGAMRALRMDTRTSVSTRCWANDMLLFGTMVAHPVTVKDLRRSAEHVSRQMVAIDAVSELVYAPPEGLKAAGAAGSGHYVLYMNGRLSCLNTVPMDIWSYVPDAKTRAVESEAVAEAVRLNMHGRMYPSWDVVVSKLAALKAFVGDDVAVSTPTAPPSPSATAAAMPIPMRAVPLKTLLGVVDEKEDGARKNTTAVKGLTAYNVTAETFMDERQAVKQCVESLFVITDRSEPEFRMRAQKLAETIEESIGIAKEESAAFRSRLSDYLLKDVGLRKQRDARGFYYFGIQAKTAPVVVSLAAFVAQRESEIMGGPLSKAEWRPFNEFNTRFGAMTGEYPGVYGEAPITSKGHDAGDRCVLGRAL